MLFRTPKEAFFYNHYKSPAKLIGGAFSDKVFYLDSQVNYYTNMLKLSIEKFLIKREDSFLYKNFEVYLAAEVDSSSISKDDTILALANGDLDLEDFYKGLKFSGSSFLSPLVEEDVILTSNKELHSEEMIDGRIDFLMYTVIAKALYDYDFKDNVEKAAACAQIFHHYAYNDMDTKFKPSRRSSNTSFYYYDKRGLEKRADFLELVLGGLTPSLVSHLYLYLHGRVDYLPIIEKEMNNQKARGF